jgi:ATPase family associated with various cellular activities (AAA)
VTSEPALIVVSGVPGVGKTVVATAVAARLNAVDLSVDPVEDAMLRCDLPAGWNVGVAAYEAVRTMAEANLALGSVVVIDAVNESEASAWLPEPSPRPRTRDSCSPVSAAGGIRPATRDPVAGRTVFPVPFSGRRRESSRVPRRRPTGVQG